MEDRYRLDMKAYRYPLPSGRIARYPLQERDRSKLLFYDRGEITTHTFRQLPGLLNRDQWLVFNNTRVIQARMKFRKPTGAGIEILCLRPSDPSGYPESFESTGSCSWICLVGNARKWKEGPVFMESGSENQKVTVSATMEQRSGDHFRIRFSWDPPEMSFASVVDEGGLTPIPPYLERESEKSDRDRYQTVYGRYPGSVAAPTAGLHFTTGTLDQLTEKGIERREITLHVGAGTFVPVKEGNARNHTMHDEQVEISLEFLEQWSNRPAELVAVGTTVTRSLESAYWLGVKILEKKGPAEGMLSLSQWEHEELPQDLSLARSLEALIGHCREHRSDRIFFSTRLMIAPGYRFRTIGGLITNFHQPGSTLLLLVAAWIGSDWRKVYHYALDHRFRFLSYGDSSLLIPKE